MSKTAKKTIEGQEILSHDEVFNKPPVVKDEVPPMANNSLFVDSQAELLTVGKFKELMAEYDDGLLSAQVHALTAKIHNMQNAFDSFKAHMTDKVKQLEQAIKAANVEIPANVTGQNTLKSVGSEFKQVVMLGRLAKESVNDVNQDTKALKHAAIEAQEAYLRQTNDPGELQFLNQSLSALRKL